MVRRGFEVNLRKERIMAVFDSENVLGACVKEEIICLDCWDFQDFIDEIESVISTFDERCNPTPNPTKQRLI
jgi:hypothetical protein